MNDIRPGCFLSATLKVCVTPTMCDWIPAHVGSSSLNLFCYSLLSKPWSQTEAKSFSFKFLFGSGKVDVLDLLDSHTHTVCTWKRIMHVFGCVASLYHHSMSASKDFYFLRKMLMLRHDWVRKRNVKRRFPHFFLLVIINKSLLQLRNS